MVRYSRSSLLDRKRRKPVERTCGKLQAAKKNLMNTSLSVSLLLIVGLLGIDGLSQTPSQPHSPNNPLPQWVIDNARKRGEFESRTRPPASSIPAAARRRSSRPRTDSDGPTAAETTEMLRPPPAYLVTYKDFLKDKDHGIFRIWPDKGCDKGLTVSVESLEKCKDVIPVKGGGSLYSFRIRNHDSQSVDFWDLHFIDGNLVGGNDSVQMIIAETDVADIETINRKNSVFESLSKYEPKSTRAEIKKQNIDLQKRIEFDGKSFSNQVQPKLDHVFAARVVAYFEKGAVGSSSGSRYDGRGLDLILAFQVVATEPDGSLVILWKELKRDLPRKKLSE